MRRDAVLRRFALGGILILAAVPATVRLQPATAQRLGEAGAPASSWRRVVWALAWDELKRAPVLGPGYHAFSAAIQRTPAIAAPGIDDPHNLYLTAAVAGGIPAAGLLILGLVVLLRLAWSQAFGKVVRPDGLALLWYWIAFVPLGLVGQNIFPVNLALFFFAMAALTAAGARGRAA